MGALDTLNSAAVDNTDPNPPLQSGIQIAAPKSTGIQGTIPLGDKGTEEILNNMQEFIKQRTNPMSQFMSGINRAYATAHGPEALTNYDRQKTAEDKQIMDYQQQMAAYKAAQAQEEAEKARWTGGGLGGTTTMGSVGAGGVPTQYNGVAVPQSVQDRLTLAKSYGQRTQIMDEWLKTLGGYEAKFANEPGAFTQQKGFVKGVGDVDWTPQQFKLFQQGKQLNMSDEDAAAYAQNFGRVTASNTPAVSAPKTPIVNGTQAGDFNAALSGVMRREGDTYTVDNNGYGVKFGINQKWHPNEDVKNMSPERATQIYKEQYWAPLGLDKLPHEAALIAFDAAVNQGPEYAKKLIAMSGGDAQKMYTQRALDYKNLADSDTTGKYKDQLPGWNKRLMDVANEVATTVRTRANPISSAAAAEQVGQPTFDRSKFKSKEEADAAQKIWEEQQKSDVAINEAEKREISKGAGERYNEMKKNAQNAKKMELAAAAIYNIASDPKKAEGLGMAKQGLNVNSVLANTIHGLGAVGTLGHMSEKEANDLAARTLNPATQDARDQLTKHASDLGIGYAAQVFHGARMGIGLEKMAMESKGIGTEFSAATNKMHSDIIKEGAKFAQAKQALWQQYVGEHGGNEDKVSFNKFESDPRYVNLEDQTRANLAKKYPDIFSATDDERTDGLNFSHVKTPSLNAPSKFDKYKK